jgi:glycopeptide antibiotics resistance protein
MGGSMLIYFDVYDLLIGIAILCILLPVLWRWKHSLSYLIFFSIFWVYLLAVVQAVIFPIAINTDNGNGLFTPSINLIPFYFGSCPMPDVCIRDMLENIILTIPFGFGINFLVRVKSKNILWPALAVGLGFELSQLVISLVFKSGFRTVDINDVIFNCTGVLLGYMFFRAFARVTLKTAEYYKIKCKGLFADVYEVVLQTQTAGESKKA